MTACLFQYAIKRQFQCLKILVNTPTENHHRWAQSSLLLQRRAGECLLQLNSFTWLDYSHLGMLVERVARGLLAAGLRAGDTVVICGCVCSV